MNKLKANDEIARRQESLYSFPYHYLATIDDRKIPRISRSLSWGFEYLTYMEVIKEEIRSLAPNGGAILDVGCGDGYLLNSIGGKLIKHGVDLSEKAISFAKAFSSDAKFYVCDIHDLNDQYDIVTCIEVLEHIPDEVLNEFVSKMVQRIKPGGHLIISVPTTVVELNKKHYRHYDESMLTRQMENETSLSLVAEKRIYRISSILNFFIRLINNRVWTINYKPVLTLFWKWHCNRNQVCRINDGAHLIRVYRKTESI